MRNATLFHPEASNIPTPTQGAEAKGSGDLALSLMDLTGDGALLDTTTPVDTDLTGWMPWTTPSINETTAYGESPVPFPEFAIRPRIMSPAAADGQFHDSAGHDMNSCACFKSILQSLEKAQRTNLQSLGLDVALRQNKEALLNICASIKCSISHDSTTRLLILVLLRKALKLYRLLFHLRLSARTVNGPSEMNNPVTSPYSPPVAYPALSSTSSVTSGQTDYFDFLVHSHPEQQHLESAPKATRLTLGTYQLDDADERSLKKQIFLLDVRKVPRLLERLDQRACGLDESDGLDLYNMMRSSLIADFRAVMTDVQS